MGKKNKNKSTPVPVTTPAPGTPPRTTPPVTAPPVTPPVKKPEDITPYRDTTGLTTLFCYGTLNVHDVQRGIWGEAKEGKTGVLTDYELKLWAGSSIVYVEKKIGERVVGKSYELTDEQLRATDVFESNMYKRTTITVGTKSCDVYVRNPEVSADTQVVLN